MAMKRSQDKRVLALQKELASVQKRESALDNQAVKSHPSAWHKELDQKIPPNVLTGLEAAFSRGFSIIFEISSSILTFFSSNSIVSPAFVATFSDTFEIF